MGNEPPQFSDEDDFTLPDNAGMQLRAEAEIFAFRVKLSATYCVSAMYTVLHSVPAKQWGSKTIVQAMSTAHNLLSAYTRFLTFACKLYRGCSICVNTLHRLQAKVLARVLRSVSTTMMLLWKPCWNLLQKDMSEQGILSFLTTFQPKLKPAMCSR